MPAEPPSEGKLSTHRTGWLLSRLRRIRPDRNRTLAANLIRELASEQREDRMSLNAIAEATGIPRATVHRWASNTAATEEQQ
jgi:DNA invertase Pin-like site-specific DNA recombinase